MKSKRWFTTEGRDIEAFVKKPVTYLLGQVILLLVDLMTPRSLVTCSTNKPAYQPAKNTEGGL